MNGCIYLVTCLENGKKYVGQHHKPDPKRRWNAHKKVKENYPFQRALRKYGIDKFSWEVLLICPHDKLTEMEGYYAEVFETYIWDNPGGYNAVWCSECPKLGVKQSSATKEKIRQSTLGKKHSPEVIQKIRQSNVGKKRSPEFKDIISQVQLGRKRSPETIEKMRQAQLGKKKTPEAIENMRIAQQKRRNQHLVQDPPLTLSLPNKII